MERFLPKSEPRSPFAFFRRDIFRAFFLNKKTRVRIIAWSGLIGLLGLVCVDVYLLYSLTNQMQVAIHAYQAGTTKEMETEFKLALWILLGFAGNDIVKLGGLLLYCQYWRTIVTCDKLDKIHLFAPSVKEIAQPLADAVKGFTTLFPDMCMQGWRSLISTTTFLFLLAELSQYCYFTFPPHKPLMWDMIAYCIVQTSVSILLVWGFGIIKKLEYGQAMEARLRDALVLIQERWSGVSPQVTERQGRRIQTHVRGALWEVNIAIVWRTVSLMGWKGINVQVFAASFVTLLYLARQGYFINNLDILTQIAGALTAAHGSVAFLSEVMFKWAEMMSYLRRTDGLESAEEWPQRTYASAAE